MRLRRRTPTPPPPAPHVFPWERRTTPKPDPQADRPRPHRNPAGWAGARHAPRASAWGYLPPGCNQIVPVIGDGIYDGAVFLNRYAGTVFVGVRAASAEEAAQAAYDHMLAVVRHEVRTALHQRCPAALRNLPRGRKPVRPALADGYTGVGVEWALRLGHRGPFEPAVIRSTRDRRSVTAA